MTRAAGTRTATHPHWASCLCCPRSRRPTRRHGSSQVGAVQRLGPECAWQGAHEPSTVISKHVKRGEPSAREVLPLQSLLLLMHGIGGFSVYAGGTDRAVAQPRAARRPAPGIRAPRPQSLSLICPSWAEQALRAPWQRDASRSAGQGCKGALAPACACC